MASDLNGIPLSAGIIWIGQGYFRISDGYSMSLGISSADDDSDYLSVMLGIPCKYDNS